MTRFNRPLLLAIAAIAGLAALLLWAGDRWAGARAAAVADAAAAQAAANHGALLASELQKFRLLPLVLIEYPDVAAALSGAAGARESVNRTLELLAARTDAADIYAIAPDGVTVAASNWRRATSFVGQNYGFRPYFRDAMRTGAAELFALGTVSRRPGLYIARAVERNGRRIGIVVVKVEFDTVEAGWARTPGASFVTDHNGVILVTSRPEWRFHAIAALDPAVLARARRTLQFGARPPRAAPLSLAGRSASVGTDPLAIPHRVASTPAPLAGGRLYHLAPLEPALAAARTQALLAGAAMLLIVVIATGVAFRTADTRRLQHQARVALEAEVASRTVELREANARLITESEQRAAVERRYRIAREELAQASRLGTLGQITAGVAHEINQPVAAIRTFAESGMTLLDRGSPDPARMNLARIVELSDRIGQITAELRGFARKRTTAASAAMLGSIFDGVMILLGERARGIVSISADAQLRAISLRGDRVRIEQILVNLLQNALDAVAALAEPAVTLVATETGATIQIVVTDNGAGVDPTIVDTLFTPFTSAKDNGLGLGLAIARDIAREFGGELVHEPSAMGARFVLRLRRS